MINKILDFILSQWNTKSSLIRFDRTFDVKLKLTESFYAGDFFCKCGKCNGQYIDIDHVKRLQEFQDYLGEHFTILSAYRCPEHNTSVGSKLDSQHIKGTATDVRPFKLTPKDLAEKAREYGFQGVGEYKTFTHVDSREGVRARWRKL